MYRESETQTVPYAPDYFVKEGEDPEVLMLKGLTHENGLPAGRKEVEMIEQARIKRDLQNNMLPFTDEACFLIRKKMMEAQELRELRLRENEMEAQRDLRLSSLKNALVERNDTAEFLASQRIEAIRQTRMDIREKTLQKIRKKRIKTLRKLAQQRNTVDPLLSSSGHRDIINDYFDHGSSVYAPLKRNGSTYKADSAAFEADSRTAPLHLPANMDALESFIPSRLINFTTTNEVLAAVNPNNQQIMLSKTAPLVKNGGGRAAVSRLTSSTMRANRNTKKDVDTMHEILTRNKLIRTGQLPATGDAVLSKSGNLGGTGGSALDDTGNVHASLAGTAHTHTPLLNRKPKGRPRTPNITTADRAEREMHPLYTAVALLQRLIRGRAVQNSMFEGRYRRAELIAELRASDEFSHAMVASLPMQSRAQQRIDAARINNVKNTTVEVVAGSITSNVLALLADEKKRSDVIANLQVRHVRRGCEYCYELISV